MSNPLIAALFGQNQGLDTTGAVKQQGQNQLNSIDAFGGLMQQRPASKIAVSNGNSRWAPGLQGLYENNPQMRPGEYDPMGVQAERRRQVQYGTQDTQDRNRLLQEQLWGNFLGKTNDMMGGRGGRQGPAQIGAAPVQENNSPGQGGVNPLQKQLDQLMRMLAPWMESKVSLDGFQPSPGQGRQPMQATGGRVPQQQQAPQVGNPILDALVGNGGLAAAFGGQQAPTDLTGQGVGAMPDPYASRPEDPQIAAAFANARNKKAAPPSQVPAMQMFGDPMGVTGQATQGSFGDFWDNHPTNVFEGPPQGASYARQMAHPFIQTQLGFNDALMGRYGNPLMDWPKLLLQQLFQSR